MRISALFAFAFVHATSPPALASEHGAPIACTLQGMNDVRLLYVPEDRELSFRWTVRSHDGSQREVTQAIVDARHVNGKPYDFSTCEVEQAFAPASEEAPESYRFAYVCGDFARGELSFSEGAPNSYWSETRLSGGFIDRKEFIITRCW